MPSPTQRVGNYGEFIACYYLRRNNYKILKRNYHSRFGEVDIIAKINSEIIFIEVKTRKNNYYGYGVESVSKKKLKKIILAGQNYIIKNKLNFVSFRVEVIDIVLLKKSYRLRHYKDVELR